MTERRDLDSLRLLSGEDVADMLGMDSRTVHRMALGVSEDFYAREIAPHVRTVRRGRVKIVAVAELQRFLDENAERLFKDQRAA